jgi:hypothetical protein
LSRIFKHGSLPEQFGPEKSGAPQQAPKKKHLTWEKEKIQTLKLGGDKQKV